MVDFYTYIKAQFYTTGNTEITHSSMGSKTGRYYIESGEKEKDFIDKYIDYVFVKKEKAYMLEAPYRYKYKLDNGKYQFISSIKIDIDLHYNTKSNTVERVYNDNHIKNIISEYINNIKEYVVSITETQTLCFVMEKSKPVKNKTKIKDGIHLIFPYIYVGKQLEHKLRHDIIKTIDSKNMFADIKEVTTELNDTSKIIDHSVIDTNNWLMYGSRKSKELEPYLLTKVYKYDEDTNTLIIHGYPISKKDKAPINMPTDIKYYEPRELVIDLSMRNLQHVKPSMIKHNYIRELYMFDQDKITSVGPISPTPPDELGLYVKKRPMTRSPAQIDIILKLVDCLSVQRASDFESWVSVCWTLHNIHNSDDVLFDKFIEFSKKGKGYGNLTEAEIISYKFNYWDKSKDQGYSEGSLRLWAKEDDEDLYNKILYEEIKTELEETINCEKFNIDGMGELSKMLKSMNNTATAIAGLMYIMYKHEFVLTDTRGKGTYYHFRNHRWEKMQENTLLRRNIYDVKDSYLNYFKNLNAEQKQQMNFDPAYTKKILDILKKLDCTSFKNDIMTECKDLFYGDGTEGKKFLEKLDDDNYLIGFENGVYDLAYEHKSTNGEVIERGQFRDGRPEDYISFSTGIDYIDYHEVLHTPQYKTISNHIHTFFDQVFIIKDVRDYVMTVLASALCGSTKNETFHVWSGTGGNGKSKLIELFMKSLGEYTCNLPITVLTKTRGNSNEASPELAITKGKRFAVLQEPDAGSKIYCGKMKELTGGDEITCRKLYENPITFKPKFKLVMTCNEKPQLAAEDEGTWRRVRLVQFGSKFTQHPDPDEPNEFPIDYDLSEKFNSWKEIFMSILINHYNTVYANQGFYIKCPEVIMSYTNEYRDNQNHYLRFIKGNGDTEQGAVIKDVGKRLTPDMLKRVFKEWCDNQMPKLNLQIDQLFTTMNNLFGKGYGAGIPLKSRGWKDRWLSDVYYNDYSIQDDELS